MNRRYLEGDALLIECRAGAGIIVIVEGETERDDAWFYQQWFGDLAREIRFFPQNGWLKVLAAVVSLRAALPSRAIYGIIDRDFTEQAIIDAQRTQCPPDGIFRTPFYTLENALLDPAVWLEVARIYGRGAITGWATVDDVTAQVADAYERCLPVGAFNRVVFDEHERDSSGHTLEYLRHPNAATGAAARLRQWGKTRGAPDDLGDAYDHRLTTLTALPLAEQSLHVTGKAVLTALCDRLNAALLRGGVPASYLADAYLREHPQPPPALAELIASIVRFARP